MVFTVDAALPAGNILLSRVEGRVAYVDKDLRDTEGNWFYWKFRAFLPEKGTYTFVFGNGPAIGTEGPAFSTDRGRTWDWLGPATTRRDPDAFSYDYDGSPGAREVWFCMGIPYLQSDLDAFLARASDRPCLRRVVHGRSRKGREVERIEISGGRAGAAPRNLFFTSRHHACEMSATYVLEGILDAASAPDDFGRRFREAFRVYAVPFVDKDGVEDGDQGKARRPHDHNRDYMEHPLYPEVAANIDFLKRTPVAFALDLHCPWLHDIGNPDGTAGVIHALLPPPPDREADALRFLDLVAHEVPANVPFRTSDSLRYGTRWNSPEIETGPGWAADRWFWYGAEIPFGMCIEVPYSNLRDRVFRQDDARDFGRAIARAIYSYFLP